MTGVFRGTAQRLANQAGIKGVLLRLEENLTGALRGVAHRFTVSSSISGFYVAEDGTTFYVAENGTDNYVTES